MVMKSLKLLKANFWACNDKRIKKYYVNYNKIDTTRIYTHATEVRLIESRDKYMKSLSLAY